MDRAALWGISEGGPMCMLFAATHPDRTSALVLQGSFARIQQAPDQPFGYPAGAAAAITAGFEEQWGTGAVIAGFFPSGADDPSLTERFARYERNSASPNTMVSIIEMVAAIDVRPILPTITVPTLVVHSAGDPMIQRRARPLPRKPHPRRSLHRASRRGPSDDPTGGTERVRTTSRSS